MNKTVRSLLLLYRCYGRAVPADDLLSLFSEGTQDVNTQRRTLRRYLVDFRRAGIEAEWRGRGARATVSIPAREESSDLFTELAFLRAEGSRVQEALDAASSQAASYLEETQNLQRRLLAEKEANNVFRNMLLRRPTSRS